MTSNERGDTVWQSADLVNKFLSGVSGAIPLRSEQLDVMLRLISAHKWAERDQMRFLDIGCGDGILSAAVLSRFPSSHCVLLDFSESMLTAARDKLTGQIKQPVFVLADYADPHWVQDVQAYAPFDVIVSGFSIHHQPDDRKRRIYSEVFNLLHPGGLFVNLEHVASATHWGEMLFAQRMVDSLVEYHAAQNSTLTRQQIWDQFYDRPDKAANLLAPLDTQCQWLREIGFADVDCFFKIFELAIFGGHKPDLL